MFKALARPSRVLGSSRVLPVCLFALTAMVLLPGDAEARRRGVPFLINTGDAIYEVCDLPKELADQPDLKGWKVGYKCKHFGILWADVACWEKELVAYKDDTYADLPAPVRKQLEAEHPWSDAKRNVWNRFGVFALVGIAGIGVVAKIRR